MHETEKKNNNYPVDVFYICFHIPLILEVLTRINANFMDGNNCIWKFKLNF